MWEELLKQFQQQSQNVPINQPMLNRKAKQLAKMMNYNSRTTKKRHEKALEKQNKTSNN